MKKTAWHFVAENRKLGYGDNRIVKPGYTYYDTNESNGQLCGPGLLHWSYRIYDALEYAPGPVLCEVEPGGEIFVGNDKGGSTERTVIRMADVTNILHEAACQSAEWAIKRFDKNPDPRSLAAIQAKRDWIAGRIANKELAAAGDAARAAAWAAARAARDAAWAAAWAAARDEQEKILLRLLKKAEWEE